jgi:hypothetical protein
LGRVSAAITELPVVSRNGWFAQMECLASWKGQGGLPRLYPNIACIYQTDLFGIMNKKRAVLAALLLHSRWVHLLKMPRRNPKNAPLLLRYLTIPQILPNGWVIVSDISTVSVIIVTLYSCDAFGRGYRSNNVAGRGDLAAFMGDRIF